MSIYGNALDITSFVYYVTPFFNKTKQIVYNIN